ncbi:MAG TPA: hypothetical protein VG897_04735 [Terriglobales bacterium]|nr:hypothetical protein [Terriglobales bacterium]
MKITIFLLLLYGTLSFADTLTLKDGSRHDGMLESSTDQYVVFNEAGMPHRYARTNVQSVEFNNAGMPNTGNTSYNNGSNNNGQYNNSQDNNAQYNNGQYANNNGTPINGVTIPAGTQISVMSNEQIDSQSASSGQLFPAEVQQDVLGPQGNVVIPKGSQAELTITNVNSGGTTGGSELALALDSINVNGNSYRVSTQDVQQQGNQGLGKNKRTGEYVGGGAVLGTLIGAIAGGGKGAAIGAVTGAAAGAGAQVLTKGSAVKVPAETTLNFRLDQPLQLQR